MSSWFSVISKYEGIDGRSKNLFKMGHQAQRFGDMIYGEGNYDLVMYYNVDVSYSDFDYVEEKETDYGTLVHYDILSR